MFTCKYVLFSGPADTDNCACPPCCYNVSVTLDYRTSQDVLQVLKGCGLNVTGLSAYGPPGKDNEPFPLRYIRGLLLIAQIHILLNN